MSVFSRLATILTVLVCLASACRVAEPDCVTGDGLCNPVAGYLTTLLNETRVPVLNKIYWAELGSQLVRRCDPDGTNVETLFGLAAAPNLMAVTSSYVYVAVTSGNGYIRRMNLDGTNSTVVVNGTGPNGPLGIAISEAENAAYWVDDNTKTIKRTDMTTDTTVEFVSTGTISPSGIDYQHGYVYWADQNTDTIERVKPDGTDRQILLTASSGISNPFTAKADPYSSKIYFDDFGANNVFRSNTDGTDFETLFGLGQPTDIAIDPYEGHLYVGDLTNQLIFRSRLDGSQLTDLGLAVNQPVTIGLYFVQPDSF